MNGGGNLVRVNCATTGTGAASVGAAVSGYLTPALSGVKDGDRVPYELFEGANAECGEGIYSSSGPSISRDIIYSSTNAGAAIVLAGAAVLQIGPRYGTFKPEHPGFRPSWYYGPEADGQNYGIDYGRISLVPLFIAERVTITALCWKINSAAASNTMRAMIYADKPGLIPRAGAFIAATAWITATAGDKEANLINGSAVDTPVTLEPGWYWIGAQNNGGTPNIRGYATYAGYFSANSWRLGCASLSALLSGNGPLGLHYDGGSYFGALPNLSAVTPAVEGASDKIPHVSIKTAA